MEKEELSGQLPVPSKVFKSIFTWTCYECSRWWPFYGFVLIGAASACFASVSVGNMAFCFFFSSACGIMIYLALTSPLLVSLWKMLLIRRRRSALASLVSELHPGLSKEKWDDVAYELNAELYDDGAWCTPYAFFNGESCRALFRQYILQPYYKNKNSDVEKNVERQSAMEYAEAIRGLFDGYCKDEQPQISPEFAQLPRDLFKAKLSFNRGFFKYFLICIVYDFMVLQPSISATFVSYQMIIFIALALAHNAGAYHHYSLAKFLKLDLDARVQILADIMVSKPQSDEDWSDLAKLANQRLRAQGTWTAPQELFYDFKEYKSLFHKIVDVPGSNPLTELVPLVQDVKTALKNDGPQSR